LTKGHAPIFLLHKNVLATSEFCRHLLQVTMTSDQLIIGNGHESSITVCKEYHQIKEYRGMWL